MKLKLLLILLFLQISIYANKIGNPFAQTGHTSNINMLSVTSDEKYLISSDDKNIIIWDYKKEMVIKRILLETYLPKLENGLKVRFKLKLLNSNNILIEWSDWKNDDTFYKSVEVDIVTEKVVKEYPMSSNSNIIDNKDIKDIDRMMNNIKSNIPLSAHDLEKDETIRNIKITSKKTSPNQKYVIYAISETKMFTSTVAKKNISYTQLYLWNINTKQLIKTYKKYAEKIEKIVFTKDSKYFYTIGHSWNKFNRNKNKNGHIAKWSLKSNTPISTLITNSDKISDLYITEDSKNIFVSTFRNVINVWNVSNNKKLNSISILGVKKIFQNSFDDNSLFFVNFENRIQLYDIKKQKVLKEFKANNVKSGYDQFNNLIYNKNGPFTRFDAKIFNQLPLLKGRQHVLNENANYTLTFEKKYNPNTSSVEKKYYIYNLNNLNEIYTLNRESSSFDNISNNGLVARIDDSEIILVNPKTKNKNKINLKNYLNYDFSLESIQFSKNGKKLYIFINTSDNKILKSSDDFAWIMYSFDLDSFQLKQEKYIPKDLGFINNFYEEKSLVLSWKFLYNIKRDTYFKFDKDGTLSNKGNFLLLNVLEKGQQYLYLYNLINSQIVQKFNIQNLDFKGWHENYNEENSFIVLENDNNRRLDYYDISSGKHILSVYLFRHSDSIIARNLNVSESLNSILDKYNKSHVEWLAITPEGFFDASKNGAKYLNVSTGPMTVSSIDKFYDTFYRPDLIQKVLNGKNISQYAKAGSLKKIIDRDSSAPTVSIKNSVKYSQNRDFTLNLEICENDKGSYNNLTLYLNGMTVDFISKDRALKLKKQNRTRKECFTIDKLISLSNGTNTIGFKATNKAGTIESNLDEIVVNYKGRSNSKPNLHILAIGVDKYRDGDLWLKYSKADAKEFTKSIKKVSKPLFKDIYTYKLLDKDVTKSKVLDMFSKIGAKTTREDVFMLYIAGHGITDAKTGAYFYLPVDFRYKNENSVREKGLSQNDFKLALSKIQAMKSLTILDTCNSGSFAEAMASRGVLQKTAINKLTRATGRATIVASSKDQVALEGYKGHGVFTYTLMEALNGKGYGTDNKITIKELASYVEDILPDRTYEKWGYEQVPQSNISGNDFPIGVK